MRRRFSIFISLFLAFIVMLPASSLVFSSYQIPFEGMRLVYYFETTQTLLQQTGLGGVGWITLKFHDIQSNSTRIDVAVNGTVTEKNQQFPLNVNSTVNYPTNEDTLLYLRNMGQQSLEIYAGPVGEAIQIIPGFSFQIPRSWSLNDQSITKIVLGSFSTYRYHTSLKYGNVGLDFYASYEKLTQVLVYGEVYASLNGITALIEKLDLRQTNIQFQSPTQTQSSNCIIATAAYGSEIAAPVQFLREFRDGDVNRTFLGHHFLSAFNAWYYSWAPLVVRVESDSSELRAGVRAVIIPLLGTLYVGSVIFHQLYGINPEAAVLSAGIVSSLILGIVYLTPIIVTVAYLKKLRITLRTITYVCSVALLLTLTGTLSHGRADLFDNLTALIVIETVLLAPTLFVCALDRI